MRFLLRQYAETVDALQVTGITRSKNNPAADYAEWLVATSLQLTLCPKSTTGHDAVGPDGAKYEIKSRRLTKDNPSRQLGALRKLDEHHFDWLIGVLFEKDFSVKGAAKIPWEAVCKHATYAKHTNSWRFLLRDSVWDDPSVEDITERLKGTVDLA